MIPAAVVGLLWYRREHTGGGCARGGLHDLDEFTSEDVAHAVLHACHCSNELARGQITVTLRKGVLAGPGIRRLIHQEKVPVLHMIGLPVKLLHALPELLFVLGAGLSFPVTRAPIEFAGSPHNEKLELNQGIDARVLNQQVERVPLCLTAHVRAPFHEGGEEEGSECGLVHVGQADGFRVRLESIEGTRRGLFNQLSHGSSVSRSSPALKRVRETYAAAPS